MKQFYRNKLWYPPKCLPFVLFNYPSLSYIILALSSAVTNLPNKTLIFHDFQGPKMKFHDFPGLENEILKFHDFPGSLRKEAIIALLPVVYSQENKGGDVKCWLFSPGYRTGTYYDFLQENFSWLSFASNGRSTEFLLSCWKYVFCYFQLSWYPSFDTKFLTIQSCPINNA